MSFVRFEALLQKYFENSDHFTVVPKIVYFDVDDLHALNSYLMRDRPGKKINRKQFFVVAPQFYCVYFMTFNCYFL